MQNLQTHPLLDSISPKAAAVNKTVLQGEGSGTTKRFNQLLDAVQAASSEGTSPADTTGAEGAADPATLQLLTEELVTSGVVTGGKGAAQSIDLQATPATSNTLTTLVAIGENTPDGQVSAEGSAVAILQPAANAATGTTPAPQIVAGNSGSSPAPVVDQPVTSQSATLRTSPDRQTVLPSAASQAPSANAQTTAAPAQAATAAHAFEQQSAQSVTAAKDSPATPTQSAPTTAANAVAAATGQDLATPRQPAQQSANTSSTVTEKLGAANLTPQAQTTTPQAAVTLGAAAPVAAPLPDGQRPQTTTTKPSTGVIQTAGPATTVDQTVPTPRPTQPGEGQQNTLPGALNATVATEAETPIAPKSVWQATQDAQPTFLSKPDAQVLAHAPEAGVVNDLPDTLSRSPAEALQPVSTANKDLTSVSPVQAAASKAPVSKPFSEALMMQVKAAEVVDGRTSVHLHPRGLGNIDVEIIAGDKDLASKVIVRVENPMILQHLRDDRHLLAQTIGVSDGTVFEFHERGAEQQGGQSNGGQTAFSDTSLDGAEPAAPVQHADILADDRIDILT